MFALRERRIHVTQEDFEMAVGKVSLLHSFAVSQIFLLFFVFRIKMWCLGDCKFIFFLSSDKFLIFMRAALSGDAERLGEKYVHQKVVEVICDICVFEIFYFLPQVYL